MPASSRTGRPRSPSSLWTTIGAATRPGCASAILADQPHALIYPELGMDPVCARLAVERLAPLQCVAWGQPQTSGLPSIDCFLSSAAMEPEHAELHYTERLVRLPNMGVRPILQEDPPWPGGRAHFGLRGEATVFWCGQMIAKYLPQHDVVFTRLACAVPDSQFLFIGFAKSRVATAQFRTRLEQAFAAAGLSPGPPHRVRRADGPVAVPRQRDRQRHRPGQHRLGPAASRHWTCCRTRR